MNYAKNNHPTHSCACRTSIGAYYLDPSLTETQWHLIKVGGGSALIVATICFLLAELTGNCSQVDKIWSVVPIIYVWEYAHLTNYHPRFVLMAILVTLWGARLTYNFSRRGAYSWKFWSGEEDYRWEVLRKMPMFNARWKWTLFNLFFISFYQNILIWLITVPAIYAYTIIYNTVQNQTGDLVRMDDIR